MVHASGLTLRTPLWPTLPSGVCMIVGVVIVAQTLYSSTKDHLNEFATLRALGASAGYIHKVILIQALMSARGIEVRSAGSGARGIEEALVWKPHAILLDINLPGAYDGIQVCDSDGRFLTKWGGYGTGP